MKFTIALLIGAAAAKNSAPVQSLTDIDWQCYSDDTAVDTFGDGCDWYDANPSGCGSYDSETFVASELCCACDGGWSASCNDDDTVEEECFEWNGQMWQGTPRNDNPAYTVCGLDECIPCSNGDKKTDSSGDGCDWYNANPDGCGLYDTAEFKAKDACCACFGGDWELGCVDWSGVDSYGDGCDWYEGNHDSCGSYDTETFHAFSNCCFCGGGAWY